MLKISQQGTTGNWLVEAELHAVTEELLRIMRNRASKGLSTGLFDEDDETGEYVEMFLPATSSITFLMRRPTSEPDPSTASFTEDEVAKWKSAANELADENGIIRVPGLLRAKLEEFGR